MTEAARYLREWQRQHRLTDAEAAGWLHISQRAFRRQKQGGARPPRQTVFLASLYPIVTIAWLEVAEAARKAAYLVREPPKIGHA